LRIVIRSISSAETRKLESEGASFIVFRICLWLARHADFILWHAYGPIKARDLGCAVYSLWDGETGVGGRYGKVTTLMWEWAPHLDAYTLSPE
jgi:hypothetical protein